jgi:hypothetical protein
MDGLGMHFRYWIALYYYYYYRRVGVIVEYLVNESFRNRTSRRSFRAHPFARVTTDLQIQSKTARLKRPSLSTYPSPP